MVELCEQCGVRPAVARAQVTRNGRTEVLNLCEEDLRRMAADVSEAEPAPSSDPVEEALEESFPASDPPVWAAHGSVREIPDELPEKPGRA